MVTNIRPSTGQHTVTERVLKEFADPDGTLAVFDKEYGQRRRFSPGAGIFTSNFDSYDSRGTEDRWNLFENSFPDALRAVHNETAMATPRVVKVLRDMLALHWTRSRGMTKARGDAAARYLERSRLSNPDLRPDRLAAAFRERTGLIASSRSELEWMNDRIIEEFKQEELAKFHSEQNVTNFAAARTRFEELDLSIRYSRGADLAIGDSPVLTTIKGRGGAGPHQDVGILKADHIAMPVSPRVLVVLSHQRDDSELCAHAVERWNAFQWSTYEVWIAALPGGTADARLLRAAKRRTSSSEKRLLVSSTEAATGFPSRACWRSYCQCTGTLLGIG